MKRIELFLIVFIFLSKLLLSQNKKFCCFPEKSISPDLKYDLLACNVYSGIHFLKAEKVTYKGVFIPVNIGIEKPLLATNYFNWDTEFKVGAASFTQFEITQYNANTLRGGLLNNDYKATGIVGFSKETHKIRIQLFHISSHLGDDYMLRNEYFERNDKSVNYEQFDVLYLKAYEKVEVYTGMGYVITPNAFRERLMIQTGIQSSLPLNKKLSFAMGCDIKFYDENKYYPDMHGVFGLEFFKNEKHQISVHFDFFHGHLPYSTLYFGKVSWLGISTLVMI